MNEIVTRTVPYDEAEKSKACQQLEERGYWVASIEEIMSEGKKFWRITAKSTKTVDRPEMRLT
jgi:SOS response regulatory protein OraA/RecX